MPDTGLSVLYNYTLEDFSNPTIIQNSFSKTVEIPGTNNNIALFGVFTRNDRLQSYGDDLSGSNFDPSKRVGFTIYDNGAILQTGYCKLDKVKKNGEKVNFYVSLYGGLGDFFYNLSYNANGEEKKLSDLDFGQDLSFKINKDVVGVAWESLENGTTNKYQTINFLPALNGVPNNFDSSNVLINTNGTSIFTTSTSTTEDQQTKNYTTKNGYMMGSLKKSYDEWQMRDLRSYMQRPALRMKSFLDAVADPANNAGESGSYEVIWDPDFFNSTNPYYENAWISLPLLSADATEEEATNPSTTSWATMTCDSGVTGTTNLVISGDISSNPSGVIDLSSYPFSYITVSAPISLVLNNVGPGITQLNMEHIESISTFWDTKYRLVGGAVFAQLLAYDADTNTVVAGSDIYCFRGSDYTSIFELPQSVSDFVGTKTGQFQPVWEAPYVDISGAFIWDSINNRYIFNEWNTMVRNWSLAIGKCPKTSHMKFVVNIQKCWMCKGYNDTSSGWNVMANSVWDADNFTYLQTPITGTCQGNGSLTLTSPSSIATDVLVSQDNLLASEYTPAEYLLAYGKMFGLYWYKDPYENKIYCLTRNNFFNGGIENIDDIVDYSQETEITPILYDHKWYRLAQETPETYYAKKYTKDWGKTYGEMRINTNYNFNSDVKDLLDDFPYQNAIMVRAKSNYFSDNYDASSRWIPSFCLDGFDQVLYDNSDEINLPYNTNNINWGVTQGWYNIFGGDFSMKPCFYDYAGEEMRGIDIQNCLFFFTGFVNTPDHFYITDDNTQMILLNDDVCWLFTESEYDEGGNRIARAVTKIPVFNRYWMNGNSVVKSFDFGDPREVYADSLFISQNSSIYSQFWDNYLTDQFDVNTRTITCYVRWKNFQEDYQRRFWFFDNAIWVLNKVIDYNRNSLKPTKCEFIKVQNTSNYSTGQLL